ncbi:MAG: SulP family inorganic anion transporter [Actinobacteria bacterium]|nr:SulP family inorganic anion transporter [Actinomycetota bacterium]
MLKVRELFKRETLKEDTIAGVVLGIESVPDGLAGGLLAGVNPVFGLYGYMMGTFSGAFFTSSSFMAVQATGAMAIIVADVSVVHSAEDPDRALFTLAIVTGVVMLVAGLFKLGSMLRWVSNAVMVGFINAVGVNIILGQLDNFSGYEAVGENRVGKTFDLLLNLGKAHFPTIAIGVITIVLIVLLERTRLGPLGMVVAVIIGSVAALPLAGVAVLNDIADIPNSLPLPVLPDLRLVPALVIPALSLAFVGLVQGAGISANFPNPDGSYPDVSEDFVGQGVANIAAGIFQGMPVGGSMSASSLVKTAGARSRTALVIAGVVMAITILVFGQVVGYIAMPALAGLLMLVGYRTVKPDDIKAVWKTGRMRATVMSVTFVLTMLIPLQNAVLAGVGISLILFVIRQSNDVTIKRWLIPEPGVMIEVNPPETVPPDEVVALQPYGSLFFAAAPVFEEKLPEVTGESRNSVVILRLRGRSDIGTTFMDVLEKYARSLIDVDSRLMIVSASDRIQEQLEVTGVTAVVGRDGLYPSDERVGATLSRAFEDATQWVASNRPQRESPDVD